MNFNEAMIGYSAGVAKAIEDHFKSSDYAKHRVLLEEGQKYIRIVHAQYKPDGEGLPTSRHVHSFVNKENGDILKPEGWKKPAKHARGNIYEADYGIKSAGVTWTGVRYL